MVWGSKTVVKGRPEMSYATTWVTLDLAVGVGSGWADASEGRAMRAVAERSRRVGMLAIPISAAVRAIVRVVRSRREVAPLAALNPPPPLLDPRPPCPPFLS